MVHLYLRETSHFTENRSTFWVVYFWKLFTQLCIGYENSNSILKKKLDFKWHISQKPFSGDLI